MRNLTTATIESSSPKSRDVYVKGSAGHSPTDLIFTLSLFITCIYFLFYLVDVAVESFDYRQHLPALQQKFTHQIE